VPLMALGSPHAAQCYYLGERARGHQRTDERVAACV
jgi:hypothetical protein